MANIAFKRGLQSALATLTPQDGTFYLTTDSHRLYVGQTEGSSTKLVDLNQYIKFVANQTELLALTPENGDFVYVKSGNMLVVCVDKNATGVDKWSQINPNSNTDKDTWLEYKSVSSSATTGDSVTSTITFTKHEKNNVTNEDITSTVTVPVKITQADLVTVLDADIESTAVASNSTKIQTSFDGTAQGDGITIKGGTNVTLSGNADTITISSKDTNTTYGISSPEASTNVVLKDSSNQEKTVEFVGGKQISVTGVTADQIDIAHGTIATTTTPSNSGTTTLSSGKTFTVVDNVTIGDNGHVTGYGTKTYKLPSDNNTINKSVAVTTPASGDLTVTITDSAGSSISGTLDNGLYVTVDEEKIYNQEEITNASYFQDLRSDVNTLISDLAGIDALRYRGTIGSTNDKPTITSLPTSGVQIGDTYKVATAGTYGGNACALGDLLIAIGSEGTNGFITIDSLSWTLVAQGSDTDTTYTLTGASNKITLTPSTGGAQSISVAKGTATTATVSSNTLKVNHVDVTRTDPTKATSTLAHGGKITAVTGVTSNAQGHITAVNTTEYTLPSDNNTTYTLPSDSVTANEKAKITLTGNDNSTDIVNFAADRSSNTSLSVNVIEDTITYEHTDYSYTAPTTTATGTLSHGGTLTVVTGANVTNGHVTGLKTTSYTLPSDNNSKYTLSGATTPITNGVKITDTLTGTNGGATTTSVTSVTSTSLKLTAGTNAYSIDLEWGTF